MFQVHIDASGPIFNGMADEHVTDYLADVVWEVTKEGRGDLGIQFIKVFKHPTGYYESHVVAERPVMVDGSPQGVIHDSGVVYGPWLEGVGSRNYPVTRFKGYHSFRIVTQQLGHKAEGIARRQLPGFLARMGGGA